MPDITSLEQLRGMEGHRMKAFYKILAQQHGIGRFRRNYHPDQWHAQDPVNLALSAANTCLYGIVHAALLALGLSPAMGFVHAGTQHAFVYDIADLYKTEITLPLAFALHQSDNPEQEARRRFRGRPPPPAPPPTHHPGRPDTPDTTTARRSGALRAPRRRNGPPLGPQGWSPPSRNQLRRRNTLMPSMLVIATTAVPDHLRGALSRWTSEVVPGIFVGSVSARVRDQLWQAVTETVGDGAAVLVYPAPTEQGYAIRTAGSRRRVPEDFDGLTLIRMRAALHRVKEVQNPP
ncbi:CRISPR-associated endoribonuclease Cas2 subtype I-E [Streptomyces sp. DSM 42143]|nr:CRISPR-associated endoribonuclease Cas2 subtype I-E [Streptomyces sp. DSM 42143]